MLDNMKFIYDTSLLMKDAGLVAASAAFTVSAAAKVHDTGGGYTEGKLVFDATAVETASTDEIYTITLQGSNSATFAGDIVTLASIELGAAAPIVGTVEKGIGRYFASFCNQFGSTVYRYLRGYVTIGGTVATGIDGTCFLSK
jgi:hypothetical protein